MLVVKSGTATPIHLHDARFTPCVSPSTGSTELAMWTTDLSPSTAGAPHQVDREELVHVLAGRLVATTDGATIDLSTGDTLAVPAGTLFSLSAVGGPARILACARAGLTATMADGTSLIPPWTQ